MTGPTTRGLTTRSCVDRASTLPASQGEENEDGPDAMAVRVIPYCRDPAPPSRVQPGQVALPASPMLRPRPVLVNPRPIHYSFYVSLQVGVNGHGNASGRGRGFDSRQT
jgi:hypothetical protein